MKGCVQYKTLLIVGKNPTAAEFIEKQGKTATIYKRRRLPLFTKGKICARYDYIRTRLNPFPLLINRSMLTFGKKVPMAFMLVTDVVRYRHPLCFFQGAIFPACCSNPIPQSLSSQQLALDFFKPLQNMFICSLYALIACEIKIQHKDISLSRNHRYQPDFSFTRKVIRKKFSPLPDIEEVFFSCPLLRDVLFNLYMSVGDYFGHT